MPITKDGIGKSKNLVVIGGRSNAFITYNITKNYYENIFYHSDREYDKVLYSNFGFKVIDSLNEIFELIESNDYFISCGGKEEREYFYNIIYNQTSKNPINVIHDNSYIESNVKLGYGNLINFGCFINTNATIGNLNILNTYVIVEHDNIIGDYNHLAPRVTTTGFVTIGNRNEIYTGASIIPFKSISDNIVIAAGAVVINDITQSGTYYGIPAKNK